VITGALGWRRWSAEAKAPIEAESLAPGVVISEVAHRHNLRPQQLFAWRQQARQGRLASPAVELSFVPVVGATDAPVIEVALGGALVRVQRSRARATLNRQNALFAGADQGGVQRDLIASLIETCKLNAVDPQAYLADVLGPLNRHRQPDRPAHAVGLRQSHGNQRLRCKWPDHYFQRGGLPAFRLMLLLNRSSRRGT
jgi:transposase